MFLLYEVCFVLNEFFCDDEMFCFAYRPAFLYFDDIAFCCVDMFGVVRGHSSAEFEVSFIFGNFSSSSPFYFYCFVGFVADDSANKCSAMYAEGAFAGSACFFVCFHGLFDDDHFGFESVPHEEFFHSAFVVALEFDNVVFCCSSARECFLEFFCEFFGVDTFIIKSGDDGVFLAEFFFDDLNLNFLCLFCD